MKKLKQVHFIGIGGIGMSALARLYAHEGAIVSGSDQKETDLTKALAAEGIAVCYEQTAANIDCRPELDLVVYTEAMSPDSPELLAGKKRGLRIVNYFTALSEVANPYYLIAVSGTHGKSTTTAMLIDILEAAGLNPTAIVGSLRAKTGSNFSFGKSRYFIVEACEYRRDFMTLEPDILVITNIEHEHVDYYPDLDSVQTAFRDLALKVPSQGAVIASSKDPKLAPVIKGLNTAIIDYQTAFDPLLKQPLPGLHNALNAAAAAAVAQFLKLEKTAVKTALENFAGLCRRFELKGEVNGAPVYDDYAHHPTEVSATIAGARGRHLEKKIVVVFQPHTYSRTRALEGNFVTALATADQVILLPIYAAREAIDESVGSELLTKKIIKAGTKADYADTFAAAADMIKGSVSADDVVLVMGAGNVTEVTTLLTV